MGKIAKDPGAPKRAVSAYLNYQNAMRDTFKAEHPSMTFGQLAKYTSAMYSQLTAPEKEVWIARSDADKARYQQELASYIPPPGYDAKGDAIQMLPQQMQHAGAHQAYAGYAPPPQQQYNQQYNPNAGQVYHPTGPTGKRSRKVIRDVHAPKRNISAYLLYQNAMREQFKRDNPGMTFGQLAKYTSHMYKNLSPDEKMAWDNASKADKERYDGEMRAYVPSPGFDAKGSKLDCAPMPGVPGMMPQGGGGKRRRRNKMPRDPLAPKRAKGSYVFFTEVMRPQVQQEFPGIKFIDMGHVLGERWRALAPEQKQIYQDRAQQDKIRFAQEIEAYQMQQQAQQQVHQQHQPQQPQQYAPAPVPGPYEQQQQAQQQAAQQHTQQQHTQHHVPQQQQHAQHHVPQQHVPQHAQHEQHVQHQQHAQQHAQHEQHAQQQHVQHEQHTQHAQHEQHTQQQVYAPAEGGYHHAAAQAMPPAQSSV